MKSQAPTLTFREVAIKTGAAGSMAAAALHLAIIPFGPEGLRYFGADQNLVDLAEEGSSIPTLVAVVIALVLAAAGFYALAQARPSRSLPWQQRVYALVTAVYLLRGIAVVPQLALQLSGADIGSRRELAFSAVALTLGLLHVPGLGLRRPAVRVGGALS